MRNQRKPRLANRICAHPDIVTCVIGGCAFDALLCFFLGGPALRAISSDWLWLLYLMLLALPAATILGVILGMLSIGPLVGAVCTKINGAPLRLGDEVMVLSGPRKGTVGEVCELRRLGQGHSMHATLSSGGSFEQSTLFRIRRSEQRSLVSPDQLAENLGMKIPTLNKICERPRALILLLAACASGILFLRWHLSGAPPETIGVQILVCLVSAGATGVPIFIACCRINGMPLRPGDQVIVLSGPYKGMLTEVQEVIFHPPTGVPIEVVLSECKMTFGPSSLLKIRKNR